MARFFPFDLYYLKHSKNKQKVDLEKKNKSDAATQTLRIHLKILDATIFRFAV